MAILTQTQTANPVSIIALRAVDRLDTVRAAFAAWNTRRQTMNELSKLTNRELNDIGLTRGDIRSISIR